MHHRIFPVWCLKYIINIYVIVADKNILYLPTVASYLVRVTVANCNEIHLLCKVYKELALMTFNIIILHDYYVSHLWFTCHVQAKIFIT